MKTTRWTDNILTICAIGYRFFANAFFSNMSYAHNNYARVTLTYVECVNNCLKKI